MQTPQQPWGKRIWLLGTHSSLGELGISSGAAITHRTPMPALPHSCKKAPRQSCSHQKHSTSSLERANLHQELKEQLQLKGVVAIPHRSRAHTSGQHLCTPGLRENKGISQLQVTTPSASDETFAVTPFPSQTCLCSRTKEESLNYTRKVRSLQKMRGYKNVTNCSFY